MMKIKACLLMRPCRLDLFVCSVQVIVHPQITQNTRFQLTCRFHLLMVRLLVIIQVPVIRANISSSSLCLETACNLESFSKSSGFCCLSHLRSIGEGCSQTAAGEWDCYYAGAFISIGSCKRSRR